MFDAAHCSLVAVVVQLLVPSGSVSALSLGFGSSGCLSSSLGGVLVFFPLTHEL